MLVLFIYLAIGGLLFSGCLMALNENIFDKSLRKVFKDLTLELGFWGMFIFSVLMAGMFIIAWLPFTIFCIVYYFKD